MHNLCFCNFVTICWRLTFICCQSIFLMLLFSIGTSFHCFFNRFGVCYCLRMYSKKTAFLSLCAPPNSKSNRNEEFNLNIPWFLLFKSFFTLFSRCSCVEDNVIKLYWSCCIGWVKNSMNYEYFAQCKVLHVSFLSTSWGFAAYSNKCNNTKEEEKNQYCSRMTKWMPLIDDKNYMDK